MSEIGYGREITDNVRGFIRVRLSSLRVGMRLAGSSRAGTPIDFGKLLAATSCSNRGRRGRPGQGVPDGHRFDRADRAPADAVRSGGVDAGCAARPAAPVGVRGGPTAAARRPGDRSAGGEAQRTRWRCSLACCGRSAPTAKAWSSPSRSEPNWYQTSSKNTAVKIVHRLPAADDREAVAATMNLTDAAVPVPGHLPPGRRRYSPTGWTFPVLAAMPDGTRGKRRTVGVTASPAAVVMPRSVTCGADCQARPCTLRGHAGAPSAPWTPCPAGSLGRTGRAGPSDRVAMPGRGPVETSRPG